MELRVKPQALQINPHSNSIKDHHLVIRVFNNRNKIKIIKKKKEIKIIN